MANSISFISAQARAVELGKAAFDSLWQPQSITPRFNMKLLLKQNSDHNHAEAVQF